MSAVSRDARTYRISASTLTLRAGDIRQSRAQIVVSSDSHVLHMAGGVALALAKAGGASYRREARKMAPAAVGDVIVTGAGGLDARYVLHAITLGPKYDVAREGIPPEIIVRRTTHRVMELLPLLGCTSVAFPQIGGGSAGIAPETIAAEMAGVLVRTLLRGEQEYWVELFLYDPRGGTSFDTLAGFFEPYLRHSLGLEAAPASPDGPATGATRRLRVSTDPVASAGADSPGTLQSRTQVHQMLQHIGDRRDQIEAQLLAALTAPDAPPDALATLRQHLQEIEALRAVYEQRAAQNGAGAGVPPRVDRVFVSSTYADLKEHREALRALISQHKLGFVGMEDFAPSERAPADYICERVEDADHYLGVIGLRYGSIDPSSGMSMTEVEYRHAVAANKPLHIFVLGDGAVIRHANMDRDAVAYGKLLALRREILAKHVCKLFTDVGDLVAKAWPVVARLGS